MGQISNLIYTGIEVCKESKIPVLFISNPGYGKTTLVHKWAEKNNYHVETIIGSSFAKEEVQGYQVNNGKDHLDFLEPYWFTRIKNEKKDGVSTILFIDEISTAPADVQGSLFRLIFERCIGNGEKLPEDTLIISAANYKSNLPDYFEITSPVLNRFCIINLIPKSMEDMFDEYLSPIDDVPDFQKVIISESEKKKVREKLLEGFKSILETSQKGSLNVTNQELSDIYSNINPELANGKVMNFISGRTISYLCEIMITAKALSLKKFDMFILEAIDGLVGLGTNSFRSVAEHKAYLAILHQTINRIIFEIKTKEIKKEELDQYSISELVNQISEKAAALEMTDINTINYSLCLAEKVHDFKANFAAYIEQDRDFVYSEIKSLQMLSEVGEMGVIFNNQIGKNMINTANELIEMLEGKGQKKDDYKVLVRYKIDGNTFRDVIVRKKGRNFFDEKDSGLPKDTRIIHHDRILAVYDGNKWVSLDNFLKAA